MAGVMVRDEVEVELEVAENAIIRRANDYIGEEREEYSRYVIYG